MVDSKKMIDRSKIILFAFSSNFPVDSAAFTEIMEHAKNERKYLSFLHTHWHTHTHTHAHTRANTTKCTCPHTHAAPATHGTAWHIYVRIRSSVLF